ncbi:410_t:CDS:1 [Gigaspora margarita]|uniref:410_t:CDS:1 n=1 Tax=Gigaspora margarita TaxID=4874 RepID=A0ABN7WHD2_GIGMA|nr:410_t:CDS:1 [Gigaspora margarita]
MKTQSNIEIEAQSNIEMEVQSNIEMEAQSNIEIEVQSNVKHCESYGQDCLLELFNNGKTCLKCRSKKNNQNAQKHEAADVNTGYGIMEDFFAILRTIKGQKIKNFR